MQENIETFLYFRPKLGHIIVKKVCKFTTIIKSFLFLGAKCRVTGFKLLGSKSVHLN